MTRKLFIAWQDPEKRRWYPVGQLVSDDGQCTFTYTRGALEARQNGGFRSLPGFDALDQIYSSGELFPLFGNRSLKRGRPEWKDYLEWLDVPESEADPIAILARSGGERMTDKLQVFPAPMRSESGEYEIYFLVHGLSHMPGESAARVDKLTQGERLLIMKDLQNPFDPLALALRTAETFPGDLFFIGYLPRYLRGDVVEAMRGSVEDAVLTVERVNISAPLQFRLLCKLAMRPHDGFVPFSSEEFKPIVTAVSDSQFAAVALTPRD